MTAVPVSATATESVAVLVPPGRSSVDSITSTSTTAAQSSHRIRRRCSPWALRYRATTAAAGTATASSASGKAIRSSGCATSGGIGRVVRSRSSPA
ncbi:hypothetical protein ACI8AG_07055 [Blastococcus sp. SYSU DS0552]